MKNKKITLATFSIIALIAGGCGSTSSETETTQTPLVETVPIIISATMPTEVVVERGAVYDANVSDADGNIAVEKINTNKYTFSDTPIYPITVTGGWIDIDADGKKTAADAYLDLQMKSYSNNITPMTTYIADSNETIRAERLNAIAQEFNLTSDELLNLPSKSSRSAILVQNAVYSQIIQNDNNSSLTSLDEIFADYTKFSELSSSALSRVVERNVMSYLNDLGKVNMVPFAEADMSESEKNSYVFESKDISPATALSNFNSIIDAELSTDYSSNEYTFEDISSDLTIGIDNDNFIIVKNGTSLSSQQTTVSNGDKIKLQLRTSDEFESEQTVTLTVDEEFTNELPTKMDFTTAKQSCETAGYRIPKAEELQLLNASDSSILASESYWSEKPYYNYGDYPYVYYPSSSNGAYNKDMNLYSVVCIQRSESATFSVTTKKDPNAAPTAIIDGELKVYYTDSAFFDASKSSDDGEIVSYEWKEGETVLSDDVNFSTSDFSIGEHELTLTLVDDGGKITTSTTTFKVYDDFTDILPMKENGGSKSISSTTVNGTKTVTLASDSDSFFRISNDTNREYTMTKFEIISVHDDDSTTRVTSEDIASVLGDDKLSADEVVVLGHRLSSDEKANYWIGRYYLTDDVTDINFTNTLVWDGTITY